MAADLRDRLATAQKQKCADGGHYLHASGNSYCRAMLCCGRLAGRTVHGRPLQTAIELTKTPLSGYSRHPSRVHQNYSTAATLVIEPLLQVTHNLFQHVHSLSTLPWAGSIVLTTILLRSGITLPFTIYARRRLARLVELKPLMQAWQTSFRRDAVKSASGPEEAQALVHDQVTNNHARKRFEQRTDTNTVQDQGQGALQTPRLSSLQDTGDSFCTDPFVHYCLYDNTCNGWFGRAFSRRHIASNPFGNWF